MRSYSKGNRQKVSLIAALMTRPEILLLDEPTVGLDPLMEAEFQALVRDAAQRGQTVFLSSHLLDEVEDVCGRVGILRDGRLVEVATLQDLRRMSTTIFDADLPSSIPSFADLPEVVAVQPRESGVRLTVNGAPGRVLDRLVGAGVTRLHGQTPTLEQIFITYYAASDTQRAAVAAAHGASSVEPDDSGAGP
jgi:ABC-2 type transport system ATP-binding protein